MYEAFYQLTEDPFRLSPDHAFCYRHPSFAKGRAYMQYALNSAEGFVVVTGSPGMGKTTLINDLLSDYGPSQYLVATLVNTLLGAADILRSTAYEFGLEAAGLDKATILERLKQLFIASRRNGTPPLLIVDEAQNLSLEAMEELRLLTNLQAEGKPLLQIFLVGQDQLREKLQDPRLEQLLQRVTAATHLRPLTAEQTASYIVHRLKVAGWDRNPRIANATIPIIHSTSQGVPRRINQFCSRLLLFGAVEEKNVLDEADARTVYTELSEEHLSAVTPQMEEGLAEGFIGEEEVETKDEAPPEAAAGAGDTVSEQQSLGTASVVDPAASPVSDSGGGRAPVAGEARSVPLPGSAWSEPGIGFSQPILDPLDQVPLSARAAGTGQRSEPYIGDPSQIVDSAEAGAQARDGVPYQVPPIDIVASQALQSSESTTLVESLASVSVRASASDPRTAGSTPRPESDSSDEVDADEVKKEADGETHPSEASEGRATPRDGSDRLAILAVLVVVLAGVGGYLFFGIDPALKVKLLELKARVLTEWGNLVR